MQDFPVYLNICIICRHICSIWPTSTRFSIPSGKQSLLTIKWGLQLAVLIIYPHTQTHSGNKAWPVASKATVCCVYNVATATSAPHSSPITWVGWLKLHQSRMRVSAWMSLASFRSFSPSGYDVDPQSDTSSTVFSKWQKKKKKFE